MPAKDYLLSSLLLCILSCPGCETNRVEEERKPELAEKIAQDLSDGIKLTSPITLDQPDLPKTEYRADRDHSSISFRTRHWEIVDLIGWFETFQVVMYSDSSDFTDAVIYAEVDPAYMRMPNMKMAGTASKAPYIDSETYSLVTFTSTEMRPVTDDHFLLEGVFSLNGVDKLITFDVRFQGFAYPGEKSICGFHAHGKIDRNDFNVAGDDQLHSGKAVHSDSIELYLDLRME